MSALAKGVDGSRHVNNTTPHDSQGASRELAIVDAKACTGWRVGKKWAAASTHSKREVCRTRQVRCEGDAGELFVAGFHGRNLWGAYIAHVLGPSLIQGARITPLPDE